MSFTELDYIQGLLVLLDFEKALDLKTYLGHLYIKF